MIGANPVHRRPLPGAVARLQWAVAVDTVSIRLRAPAVRHFDIRYWVQAPAYEERRLSGTLLSAVASHYLPRLPLRRGTPLVIGRAKS